MWALLTRPAWQTSAATVHSTPGDLNTILFTANKYPEIEQTFVNKVKLSTLNWALISQMDNTLLRSFKLA